MWLPPAHLGSHASRRQANLRVPTQCKNQIWQVFERELVALVIGRMPLQAYVCGGGLGVGVRTTLWLCEVCKSVKVLKPHHEATETATFLTAKVGVLSWHC